GGGTTLGTTSTEVTALFTQAGVSLTHCVLRVTRSVPAGRYPGGTLQVTPVPLQSQPGMAVPAGNSQRYWRVPFRQLNVEPLPSRVIPSPWQMLPPAPASGVVMHWPGHATCGKSRLSEPL